MPLPSEQKQVHEALKWYVALLASVLILFLGYIYYKNPTNDETGQLFRLFIATIPSAIVALSVIPIAYIFLFKRGLTLEQQLNALFRRISTQLQGLESSRPSDDANTLHSHPNIIKAMPDSSEVSDDSRARLQTFDVFLVVDVQNDFITGRLQAYDASSLFAPLNRAMSIANSRGSVTVLTRDWHPDNHDGHFKPHGKHCVERTKGADFPRNLVLPENRFIADFGVDILKEGYDPFENAALVAFLSSERVRTIFVGGMALEYCVQKACLGARKLNKRVVAVEPLIRGIGQKELERDVWDTLRKAGVERSNKIPEELSSKPTQS